MQKIFYTKIENEIANDHQIIQKKKKKCIYIPFDTNSTQR